MASEIAFGVIGLLGAVIGGGVTLGITALSHREQRRMAARLRDQHLADERRHVCSDFLEHAELFRDHARAVVACLEPGTAPEALAQSRLLYDDAWSRLKGKNAAVQVAGPPPLADAARELVARLGDYSDLVEARERAGRWPSGHDAAFDAVISARDRFVETAQLLSASHDA